MLERHVPIRYPYHDKLRIRYSGHFCRQCLVWRLAEMSAVVNRETPQVGKAVVERNSRYGTASRIGRNEFAARTIQSPGLDVRHGTGLEMRRETALQRSQADTNLGTQILEPDRFDKVVLDIRTCPAGDVAERGKHKPACPYAAGDYGPRKLPPPIPRPREAIRRADGGRPRV